MADLILPPPALRRARGAMAALAMLIAGAVPAWAVLNVNDRGPTLRAGKFNLRVSNAGIFGNPFPERSFDRSCEYPKGSGQELLHYGALWVGALTEDGEPRVSGGPLLEWRPTPAPNDTVAEVWHGQIGSLRAFDDDGDGKLDEERLDGRDDDGDGRIDEDLGMIGQQMLSADYRDDRPEAVGYSGAELHRPLGISVHQEAAAWSYPGYDGIAGLQFTITNRGDRDLSEVYVGFYADFEMRSAATQGGIADDGFGRMSFSRSIPRGTSSIYVDGAGMIDRDCFERFQTTLPIVVGREGNTALPVAALLPLDMTRDPLASLRPSLAWGPAHNTFRASVFGLNLGVGHGGPPILDVERYAALRGSYPQCPEDYRGEPIVLVSCGPYRRIAPGQSIRFSVALVIAPVADSLRVALGNAAYLFSGVTLDRLPNRPGSDSNWWIFGETGINGHEVCVEAPPGVEFTADPHCSGKFATETGDPPGVREALYRHGQCIWTDADCDACTGVGGSETLVRWVDVMAVPPSPTYRVAASDRRVLIEWDNLPEILIAAGRGGPGPTWTGDPSGQFAGYKVYRLADWRDRHSLLPPPENWAMIGAYGYDTRDSKLLLSTITDTSLALEGTRYGRPYYPIGRYAVTDTQVFDGFDYLYVVTSVSRVQVASVPVPIYTHIEGPLTATFGQVVRPRAQAKSDARSVWVVPNPFRAAANWDRTAVRGDPVTRHLDFMGLPQAHCTIRIWTVAGDHVATIRHDGSGGSGQASWDLVSRNGQDVVSGIYIFTVESSLGNASGRFVVIR